MRFKGILLSALILIGFLPFKTLADQEDNFISISESILKNSPYLPEELSVFKTETEKEYSEPITAEEAVYGKITNILVTGYSSTPDQCWGNPFITASGEHVKVGTMACPPQYAFGTQIEIEGMGTYVCEDRGGKIKGNHFDMWFTSREEALNWGKRTVIARIIQS